MTGHLASCKSLTGHSCSCISEQLAKQDGPKESAICGFCGFRVEFEDSIAHIEAHLNLFKTLKGAALREAIEAVEARRKNEKTNVFDK